MGHVIHGSTVMGHMGHGSRKMTDFHLCSYVWTVQ